MPPLSGAPTNGGSAQRTSGLVSQQVWLVRAITSLEAHEDARADVAGVLTPSARLTSRARLQIYRDGYLGRLVECLADDYPALQNLFGKEGFERLAHGYIDVYPSRSPNLNAFGRSMPAFLVATGGPLAPFAADLARVEWAMVEAIHAAASPKLTLDRLKPMTPAVWARATLRPAAATVVLRLSYPANRYYQAFREGVCPTVPRPADSAVLIHRRGWVVWRSDLTGPMTRLLEALLRGAPISEALAGAIDHEDEETEANVTRWFQDWVGGGVFTSIDPHDP